MKFCPMRRWRGLISVLALVEVIILSSPFSIPAQILCDLGPNPPEPGAEDIYQVTKQDFQQFPDGLNYYDDNGVLYPTVGAPGQTFTTGTNRPQYTLTTLGIKTAGIHSSFNLNLPQNYELRIYSVSGTNAVPMTHYTAGPITIQDGDWLQWLGLDVSLSPGATYAYSFGRTPNIYGWEAMGTSYSNTYSSGEIALIPTSGGAMTFGRTHTFDAMFDLGFDPVTAPGVSWPICFPTNYLTEGSEVSLQADVVGGPPLLLQWQFNGGPLIGQTNRLLTLQQVGRLQGGIYALWVSNAFGSVISSNVTLTVIPAVPLPPALAVPSPPEPVEGLIRIAFPSVEGESYTVQANLNLTISPWSDVTNLLGNGSKMQVLLPVRDHNVQFFRVRSP